jgi:hypothetical protein
MAKFVLLQHDQDQDGEWTAGWSPADIRAHLDYHRALEAALVAAGELVESAHLTGPDQARCVSGDAVTAGPAGRPGLVRYWVVDVPDEPRALAIAARLSAAPGASGTGRRCPVEVRRLMVPDPSSDA